MVQMSNVRVFLFLKTMEIHAASVHEKKPNSNVKIVTTVVLKRGEYLEKTYQFMRRISLFKVT